MKKLLIITFSLFLFSACGNLESTDVNENNDSLNVEVDTLSLDSLSTDSIEIALPDSI